MENTHRIYTILLVDDEEGIRNVLDITLTHAGFKVLLAADGDTGFKTFLAQKPDIVITDIKMPGIGGIDLLKQIKQISPDTEVIMITGHGDMDLAVKSLQYEAADFITKPIDSNELELSVKKAVDRMSINQRMKSYMDDLEKVIRKKDREIDESQSLATIGQTVAGMSHVIKNIAGGLKGSSFILEQGIENENREYLVKGWEMMKGNIDKITNLSLDLLNYAKTSRPKLKQINPNHPAREVVELLSSRASEKQINISLYPLEKELSIMVDCDAIYTVIFTLVTNALDACEEKNEVSGTRTDKKVDIFVEQQSNWIVYRVRDNGQGMDDNVSGVLFKEFITTKGTRGTGFGLMTAKKIIDEHKGRILFESKKGQGSVFAIKIPLQPVQTGRQ
ncbi:MAG: response regulator [Proteobacteria bacterium]|nr:response regulator [Desulfobacula sp.]MBU4129314.1 response regulator [Pseudomonadota bacterium]